MVLSLRLLAVCLTLVVGDGNKGCNLLSLGGDGGNMRVMVVVFKIQI